MKRPSTLLINFTLAALLVFPALWGSAGSGRNSPRDAVYRVGKQAVQLIDGYSESEAAPGSTAKIVTLVVKDPVFGDLDGDGQADAALFLSQASGGSGTFLYVAAAVAKNNRWQGTNAVFIGDRVAPQTIRIGDGVIVARYLDRRPEESMAVTPSVEKTLEIEIVNGHLEVRQP